MNWYRSVGLGSIKSLRINADATRVALICDQSQGTLNSMFDYPGFLFAVTVCYTALAEVHVPDSRVFVYEVETDRLQSYDFGPSHFVRSCFFIPHGLLLTWQTYR